MALVRRCILQIVHGNGLRAIASRTMCSGTEVPAAPAPVEEAKDAADAKPPELVFAGAMFHSETNWMLRAAFKKFSTILKGKKKLDKLKLKYLRKSGQRRAVEGKREYPPIIDKFSRVGQRPIEVPNNVTVKIEGQYVEITGPQGTLSRTFRPEVAFKMDNGIITVSQAMETKKARAFHGLSRTLVSNMVTGVSEAFVKRLQMVGIGYRALVDGKDLVLSVGFNEPVRMAIPEGLSAKVEENTKIAITGRDNVLVGNFAALVRQLRKPEPYNGKGIRYEGEVVRRKESKGSKKGGK